jgi:hypothetical protein
MCDQYNGMSLQQTLIKYRLLIEQHGFTMVAVTDPIPWTYTIGLAERFHPELLMAGVDQAVVYGVLDRMAKRVVDGEAFQPGIVVERGEALEVVEVDESHLHAGLCNMWHNYDDYFRPDSASLSVLQVRVHSGWFCRGHLLAQPYLDLPGHGLGASNRALRRRMRRSSRR